MEHFPHVFTKRGVVSREGGCYFFNKFWCIEIGAEENYNIKWHRFNVIDKAFQSQAVSLAAIYHIQKRAQRLINDWLDVRTGGERRSHTSSWRHTMA